MKQVTVTVVDPVGLHARPATVAVNAASKFKSEINVAFKGREVNMKSIMGVMSLGVPTKDITSVFPGTRGKERFSGIGVNNVVERLHICYGTDDRLQISSQPGKGTICRITIPLLDQKENE